MRTYSCTAQTSEGYLSFRFVPGIPGQNHLRLATFRSRSPRKPDERTAYYGCRGTGENKQSHPSYVAPAHSRAEGTSAMPVACLTARTIARSTARPASVPS